MKSKEQSTPHYRFGLHPLEIGGFLAILAGVLLLFIMPSVVKDFGFAESMIAVMVVTVAGGFLLVGQQRRINAWKQWWDARDRP